MQTTEPFYMTAMSSHLWNSGARSTISIANAADVSKSGTDEFDRKPG